MLNWNHICVWVEIVPKFTKKTVLVVCLFVCFRIQKKNLNSIKRMQWILLSTDTIWSFVKISKQKNLLFSVRLLVVKTNQNLLSPFPYDLTPSWSLSWGILLLTCHGFLTFWSPFRHFYHCLHSSGHLTAKSAFILGPTSSTFQSLYLHLVASFNATKGYIVITSVRLWASLTSGKFLGSVPSSQTVH